MADTLPSQSSYYEDVQRTILPDWFNQAQRGLLSQAQAQYTPAAQAAVDASGAVGTAAQNLSQQAGTSTNVLNQIAQGAANPWLASGAPDTTTPFGNLFAAQQQQLAGVLPDIQASQDAAAIAGGGFGGLRGLTAGNVARGQAANQLAAQQAQAWLQSQQVGTEAAKTAANVGVADLAGQVNAGTFGIRAPLDAVTQYANILGSIGSNVEQGKTLTPSPFSIESAQQAYADNIKYQKEFEDWYKNQGDSVFRSAEGGSVPSYAGGGLSMNPMINNLFGGM